MASAVVFDRVIQSGDQSFDRLLSAGLPVAALFWSGPRSDQDLEAELNNRARAEAGKLLVVKVKKEDNPELVKRYAIRAPYVFITFRDGREVARFDNPTRTEAGELVEHLFGRGTGPSTAVRSPKSEPRASSEGGTLTITDGSFERDVVNSTLPVVVDFWAPWCGPCRMVSPALEKVAVDFAERLRVAKMNVDENPKTAERYQVSSIPTLLFMKRGQAVDRIVGALPESQIRLKVEQFLRS